MKSIKIVVVFLFCLVLKSHTWTQNDNLDAVQTMKNPFERIIVVGDFDGDSQPDTLQEAYINKNTKEEIEKISFDNCKSQDCVDKFIETNNPGSYLFFKSRGDTLFVSYKKEDYPTFGITGLLNIGNIDENQGDELAIITGWANHTLITKCEIWTFNLDKWEKLKDFYIHEEQIFDGSNGKIVLTRNSRSNKSINSKGVFFLGKENNFYYEYDRINGKILERKLKIE